MADDTLKVILDGTEFRKWTSVSIKTAIDQVASGFALTSFSDPNPNNTQNADIRKIAKPFSYTPIEIRIGSKKILNGYCEITRGRSESNSDEITLTGRSKTGQLLDSAIEGSGNLNGLTLSQLATNLCRPFGITVEKDPKDRETIEVLRPDLDGSVFDYLKKCAEPKARILIDTPEGNLKITQYPTATGAAATTFTEGKDKFEIDYNYDGTRRFSQFKIFSQLWGNPVVSGRAVDSSIKLYRPFRKMESNSASDNVTRGAEWARALSLARACGWILSCPGWLVPSGNRKGEVWNRGDNIIVKAPRAYLNKEIRLLITGIEYKETNSEKSVDLVLVLPQTYTKDFPTGFPWD